MSSPSLSPQYQTMLDDLDGQVLQLDRQVFRRLANLGYHPQVIFDVGASNSGWSYYMKQVATEADFYLFEPLVDHVPDYQGLMAETLRVYPSFHLYKYALGDRDGTITVNVFNDPASSTTLAMPQGSPPTKAVQVPLLTLDSALAKLHLPQPQVIKIDTQGNELAILRGAPQTLTKVDVLFLECWLYRGYGPGTPLLTEIANWLLPLNFRLWDVSEPYRGPQGELTTLDCIFINTAAGLTPDWYY
ncbi:MULTISPECIES: FkbM family methyltransferase [Synechocystis]|uniref:FkbM family methyltransferase n=1 Tax=Synechocystis salina LEGE 00031 TaxID=1828736 RepID=A0ABR9VMM2_9SYNC|nr:MULTISPECIES: FkbM family methyltransferase [Synechocystis]MBE9195026.1 FkbM family methyltransferase [Synechocystis sp. LEGE 06083]MBE9240003.1 FkbM family methyltransferase [Synechocystis salina LEGE 00041]MBE9252577.1 FkbM family methyltransferase [Synechocystis salina LEGE 00031]